MDDEDQVRPDVLPGHESGVRRMVTDSSGTAYRAFSSLSEVKNAEDGVVVLEGDDGGQIYVVAGAGYVGCTEAALGRLLREVDARAWKDPDAARVFFEVAAIGTTVAGGMGGGRVVDGIWIHRDLVKLGLEERIKAVLRGDRESIAH